MIKIDRDLQGNEIEDKILQNYASLDDFINQWNKQEKKIQIVAELENQGVLIAELQNDLGEIGGKEQYFLAVRELEREIYAY